MVLEGKGSGIVRITKTTSPLSRWTPSYNIKAHISAYITEIFNTEQTDDFRSSEYIVANKIRDSQEEEKTLYQNFGDSKIKV